MKSFTILHRYGILLHIKYSTRYSNMKNRFLASMMTLAFIAPAGLAQAATENNVATFELNSRPTQVDVSYQATTAPEQATTVFGLPLNMGPGDRIIRGVIAAGLIGAGSYGFATCNFPPALSGTLLGVSAIPIATAATGYCPLYSVFGIKYSF